VQKAKTQKTAGIEAAAYALENKRIFCGYSA
jgi:hypothetical protein